MEITEKEYKTCKYLIKSWEKKFKERKKCLPTKEDIKKAPGIVKDAYKIYWYAKTSLLEETIIEEEEDLQSFKKINSATNEDTNPPSVWGDHLKKISENVESSKLEKSSSFQFTEKLFKGSKFKKRNPRKSLSTVQRSESPENVYTVDENFQNSLCETDSSSKDLPETDYSQDNVFNNVRNVKVTSSKSFLIAAQSVNILHKMEDLANPQSKIIKNKLDIGWLDRCNKQCELGNSLKLVLGNDDSVLSNPEQNITSDEDFVYSSEDELPVSKKLKSDSYADLNKNRKIKLLQPQIPSDTLNENSVCSSKDEFLVLNKLKTDVNVNWNTDQEMKLFQPKVSNSGFSENTVCGSQHDLLVSKKPNTQANTDFNKDRKIKLLKQKISSGRINENFVGIDLKRKHYSRGKKSMTYTKYKKQQWKMKKFMNNHESNTNVDLTGVMKCFKCGDVGHFSKQCKKNNTLLPLEEYSDTEDSPFPTLEEAAEMVKEKSKFNSRIDDVEKMLEQLDSFEQPNNDEDNVKHVPPLSKYDDDQMLEDTAKKVQRALKKFGYEKFRPGQEEAIMRIVSGKSTLFVSSTGSGKSLCYQIPAYLYAERSKCISVIISPLLSLMEDQIINFPRFLNAACLHTNQSAQQREKIIDRILKNEVSVLLISPEAMVSGERGILGRNLMKNFPPVAFVCIDEVHCVSQWSHNFRTSYLMICKILKEQFKVRTFLGLTATATKSTIRCIKEHLGIPSDCEEGVLEETILPENLILSVSEDEEKDKALLTLLQRPPFSEFKSIIIYCLRRNECERLACYLRASLKDLNKTTQMFGERGALSVEVEVYHAGISAARRKRVQNYFMKGKLRIVVATVAFGMGINKSDIRGIIHYNMPRTFEHYVQEIGRAGRDGLPARCHLFFDSKGNDLPELKRFIYANSVDRHTIRKLLQKVFVPCQCTGTCAKHEIAFSVNSTVQSLDLFSENISTLLCYLELLPEKIVKVLPIAYTQCTVQSFNGVSALRQAARKCPALAFIIAEHCRKTSSSNITEKLEFSIVELANQIGWESGVVKNELKRSEWMQVNGKYKKTGISITFQDPGFHVLSPGNLNETELDNALNTLYDRVLSQENTQLLQLEICNRTFESISYNRVEDSLNAVDVVDRNNILRESIRNYFTEEIYSKNLKSVKMKLEDETTVICDIHRLVLSHKENTFTGRTIARIFHGIESPNFSAVYWSRSPFWRCHLNEDFNLLCQFASRELVLLK